jgi:hypothetical protein
VGVRGPAEAEGACSGFVVDPEPLEVRLSTLRASLGAEHILVGATLVEAKEGLPQAAAFL